MHKRKRLATATTLVGKFKKGDKIAAARELAAAEPATLLFVGVVLAESGDAYAPVLDEMIAYLATVKGK